MEYDVLVLGGGSFGFNAARVARDHVERVAIVDGAPELGGLCILRGCMPSKTLLWSAEVLHLARHGRTFGLAIEDARADMRALHERKLRIIGDFADYRLKAMSSGRYDVLRSQGRLVAPGTVELADGRRVTARHVFIGTGSRVAWPDVPGLRESGAWTSDDVLDLDFVPESVLVLGGGVVACELAQFLRRIGARVTQIQRSPRILRELSPEASATVEESFRDEGIELVTCTALQRVRLSGDHVEVEFIHEGKLVVRRARHLFNALGRVPATSGIGLETVGIAMRANGQIIVDEWQRTSVPGIYAGGDCTGPYEIVHLAVQQGERAARHALGLRAAVPFDERLLVNVVFTSPAIAEAGRSKASLVAAGQPFLEASYPFDDHGKSILMEARRGFVRVFADPRTGRILGAEIVGPDAGELIHIFTVALAMNATAGDLLAAPWYHPTLAEIVTYPLEEIAEQVAASAH